MNDATRMVYRLRLRMKCIMCSDPMLFVRGREKIMTVKIAWLLCHLHCLYGTCLGPVIDDYIHTHTQPTVYCHMQSLHKECCHTLPVYYCLLPSCVP